MAKLTYKPWEKAVTLFLIFILFYTSGCVSLRRKFVRKKKYVEEAPVYVNFKDYPVQPSRDAYIDYYLFVRGWLDELEESLREGASLKREKRAINEAIMNFEQIISFFKPEGKEAIYPLYTELLAIRKQIQDNPNLGEMQRNSLVSQIERFLRRFEAGFKYTEAEKWMN
jgi:hypothetical protein